MKLDLVKDVDAFVNQEINRRKQRTPDMSNLRDFDRHLVFVYGTLKQGFSNHRVLHQSAKFLGRARSHQQNFIMQTTGGFPVVFNKEGDEVGHYVYGEVYAVTPDNMVDLDGLESNGSMYTRRKVMCKMLDQHPEQNERVCILQNAWMYIGENDFWGHERKTRLKNVPLSIPLNAGLHSGFVWTPAGA